MDNNKENKDKNIGTKKPDNTKRLVYSATFAAIAGLCLIATSFLPLRFSLLMVASICFYLALDKCGKVYGILCIIVSLLLSFVRPFSSAFFLTIIIFAPYAIIAYFLKPLNYLNPQNKPIKKTLIIRPIIMAVFSNLALLGVYLVVKLISVDYIDFDLLSFVSRYSYIGIAILLTLASILFDIAFSQMVIRLVRFVK